MAIGTVTLSAADYPTRAIVTVTEWAGELPAEGYTDRFYEVGPSTGNLVIELEETTGAFCYRFVLATPATLAEEVRYVTVDPGPADFADLEDVDPSTFEPVVVTPTLTAYILQLIADNAVSPETIADAVADYLGENPTEIADVVGLVAALAGKVDDSELAAISSALAAKADAAAVTTALAGKSNTGHGHAQSDVTGLVAALAALAPLVHTHAQGDVTGLTAALAALAPLVHTHAQSDVTGLVAALAAKADSSHTHAQEDVTGLVAALAALAPLASPAFTGNPTAPTPSTSDDDTSVATTAFVKAAITAGGGGGMVGQPVYISTTEPAAAGPLLWVKDLGGNAYSLAIKTP